jgi:hypothetical protein
VKKCKICKIIMREGKGDYCNECAELVAMVIHTSSKLLRAQVLYRLFDRLGINEGKTEDDVMREIIEGKRR